MASIRAQAIRWESTDFPGWLEVVVTDAAGRQHSILDKWPIFGATDGFTFDMSFPAGVEIACEVEEEVGDAVRVFLAWAVETTAGEARLTVPRSSLV